MTDLAFGGVFVGFLFVLVLLGMNIAVALITVAFAGVWIIRGDPSLAMKLMYMSSYNGISDYLFATIPLFVLMGLLVSISNVGRDTFEVAEAILHKARGGLGVATIAANTVFAAVTGVSIASAAVFTRIAVPELKRHGYRTAFAAGTVAGSSILGMLIPPSLLLIIYGVLAEESIGKLFIAGLLPGLFIAACFILMVILAVTFVPSFVLDLEKQQARLAEKRKKTMGLAEIIRKLLPISALVVLILGGLYSGFFTPTEAGGIGAFGAMVIALMRRKLNASKMWRVLRDTGSISVSILILLIGAGFYSRMLSLAGVPVAIGDMVTLAGLGPYGFLAVYIGIILILGMILDSTSILLIMTPIAAPIALSFGFDLIHFGIITVIAVEIGLLTPPFGISVFTVKSALNDPEVSVESIFAGSLPYVGILLLVLIVVALVPELSLALL